MTNPRILSDYDTRIREANDLRALADLAEAIVETDGQEVLTLNARINARREEIER